MSQAQLAVLHPFVILYTLTLLLVIAAITASTMTRANAKVVLKRQIALMVTPLLYCAISFVLAKMFFPALLQYVVGGIPCVMASLIWTTVKDQRRASELTQAQEKAAAMGEGVGLGVGLGANMAHAGVKKGDSFHFTVEQMPN